MRVISPILLSHLYFLHKGIWDLFSLGGNFREDKIAKNVKITKSPNVKISRFTVKFCLGYFRLNTNCKHGYFRWGKIL